MRNRPLTAVVGPTATGKSDLALVLAENLGESVILNADSMQLYRGLDVGTAKTPVAERRGIPHLLFDQLEVHEEASVAQYQKHAREQVTAQRSSGRAVVAVGGSGLYVRALLDDIEFPGTDPQVRATWERRAAEKGSAALHQILLEADPEAAARIHPNNSRRIVRALEVIELTGRPFTASLPKQKYFFEPTVQIALDWDLPDLDARINARTAAMFTEGLLDETAAVLESGGEFGKTAARATGYAQALAVIEGTLRVEDAVDQVSLATRQLARRQLKWFRRDPRIIWLDPHDDPHARALSIVDQAHS